MLFLYGVIGGVWTHHALKRQKEIYGTNWLLIPCGLLNALFWPIAMILVWYKSYREEHLIVKSIEKSIEKQ